MLREGLTLKLKISSVINFYTDVLSKLQNDQYLFIVFRIKNEDNLYRNISTFQTISKLDIKDFTNTCLEYWQIKTDNYIQEEFTEFIFNYKIIEEGITSKKIHRPESNTLKPIKFIIGNYSIPQTMDLYQWGDVQFILNDSEAIVFKFKSKAQYHVTFSKHLMTVKYVLDGKTLLEFTDELLDINNLGSFTRTINNQKIYFFKGKLAFKERTYKFNKINKESPKPFFNDRLITMDLETFNKDGILTPYAVSYYDGKI